jgi:Uma2 family endonuclease
MSESPLHSFFLQFLQEALAEALPAGRLLRTEQPLTCGDSELEPDIAVVAGRKEDFRDDHPCAAELVIEISIASHDYDRSKLGAYAAAGVKECWLVLCPEQKIEVYRQPADGQFTGHALHGPGGALTSAALPEFTLSLDAFFAR